MQSSNRAAAQDISVCKCLGVSSGYGSALMDGRRRRPSDDELRAWRGLLETHALTVRRLDRELRARHGLPLDWYDVLYQLEVTGGDRTMSELAASLLIAVPSSCTRLIDRMEAAGLVQREADPDDARVRRVRATGQGRAALRRAAPTHLAGISDWFAAHMEPGQALMLADLFDRITAGLDDG